MFPGNSVLPRGGFLGNGRSDQLHMSYGAQGKCLSRKFESVDPKTWCFRGSAFVHEDRTMKVLKCTLMELLVMCYV
jgi:hypothetical protein